MKLDQITTALKDEIARKGAELRKLQSALETLIGSKLGPVGRFHAKRRTMSRAARAKIAAAARARWAKRRAEKAS
jgi:hypothetical protein